DPDIRKDYLGLSSSGAITAAIVFADTEPGHPEPDLAMLSFFSANGPAIQKWEALLGEGKHISVTAGSDAHQNAIPVIMADGERGDSYRRVMRWFGNVALVSNPRDVDQVKAALDSGRMFATFELLGTPEGFDAYVTKSSGAIVELGGTLAPADGGTLTVTVPTVRNLDPSLPAPTITGKVVWIDASGPHDVGSGDSTFNVHLGAPGAYRVEITITPSHLGPYLGDLGSGMAEVALPWIYASPFYVE
ncbi:MAG: hypothetical protein ABI175_12395, partial [Polyangiales bacterium]